MTNIDFLRTNFLIGLFPLLRKKFCSVGELEANSRWLIDQTRRRKKEEKLLLEIIPVRDLDTRSTFKKQGGNSRNFLKQILKIFHNVGP